MSIQRSVLTRLSIGALGMGLVCGCSNDASPRTIAVDGSSTVFPLSEAVAEDFVKAVNARVAVSFSDTGGGFQKFCAGEIVVAGASRPIGSTEVNLCAQHAVQYVELPVAYDAIVVVVNPANSWADSMTVGELKRLWEPAAQGKVARWSDMRPGWPDREIHLFGAGVDSGTFDYFTAAIVGEERASRSDFTSSEDDKILVQGVAGDDLALGFFGYAYYHENRQRLKLVAIDNEKGDDGAGPVLPSAETVNNGTYQPLARPIFIYVSMAALSRREVAALAEFYVDNSARLSAEVGYIPLPTRAYELARRRLDSRTTGSMFGGRGSQVGLKIEELLERETAR